MGVYDFPTIFYACKTGLPLPLIQKYRAIDDKNGK
jgi:hypothetical protein